MFKLVNNTFYRNRETVYHLTNFLTDAKQLSMGEKCFQFEDRFNNLKKEYEKLIEEYKWNELVYKAKFNFEPVIGQIYHLYYSNNGDIFLSLIEPNQWSKEHIGSFSYNHDNKWEKI